MHASIPVRPRPFPTAFGILTVILICLLSAVRTAHAGIAYGSINNFDTVNDTGTECHGFEIEIDDCHSTDITYTYNYNHYGVCSITEDSSLPGHPKCVIRWASKKNPDGTWASYTAIPTGPITPTNGHMFTNPGINFGGEHFGVGYSVAVGAVRYHWLVDDGSGALMSGGAVEVSTPTFTYYPAAGLGGVPQVQAEIAPPEPAEAPEKQFGQAVWVKEIRTTTHNNHKVKLRDLVSDDPADADDVNWRNGEPDEVEVDWMLLQTEFGVADGGKNGKRNGAGEDLVAGDEIITRRYEFFKYVGPLDVVTSEALADAVGADDLHGSSTQKSHGGIVDYSDIVVVGEYAGAQMAAVDVEEELGLIEHVSEGKVNAPYTPRTVVITGALPAAIIFGGTLPNGMSFDEVTGVLAGTPLESGEFAFKVTASDGVNPDVERRYTLRIATEDEELPASSLVDTSVSPLGTGTSAGDGSFVPGSEVTVSATAAAGFRFKNWTDNGKLVSTGANYTFTIDVNHSLVANFIADVPQRTVATSSSPSDAGSTSGGGPGDDGSAFTVLAIANPGYTFMNWTEAGAVVSTSSSYTFTATADHSLVANFTALPTFTVGTSSVPSAVGGTTTGGGAYISGSNATVTATAEPGYFFSKWTVNGSQASTSSSYTFTVTSSKTLVANFLVAGTSRTISTTVSNAARGSASGGGNYLSGDSATVLAVANPGYAFVKWKEGSSTASTSRSYTFIVTVDRTLMAEFQEAFVISTSSSPATGGSTDMSKPTYQTGDRARARAISSTGYTFSKWTEDGTVVSTDATFDFDATGNRALVAHFLSTTGVTIATSSLPVDGGSTAGEGSYATGDHVIVSANPAEGFKFVSWTDNGAVMSENREYTFPAGSNRTLVANFLKIPDLAASQTAANPGVMVITWPAASAGWILEESPDLRTWTSSPRDITTSGGQNRVSVDCDGGCRYFRLMHAP